MDLRLTSLYGHGLRSDSQLILHLRCRSIDICSLQVARFDCNYHKCIRSNNYIAFSAYFDGRSRGVPWLVSRRLVTMCTLIFSDPADRLGVLDVTIKNKAFQLIGVYGPMLVVSFLTFSGASGRTWYHWNGCNLIGDWNTVLDPNLDRRAISASTNTLNVRYFRKIVERFDLVEKFRNRHPNKLAWIWNSRGPSAQLYNSLARVIARRVDLDYLGRPSFEQYKDSHHTKLCVSITLDKARHMMFSYWKFNILFGREKLPEPAGTNIKAGTVGGYYWQ